jgi:two-component system, chemotaxis family, protein-glutamate methylesterase/glutaminase
MAAKRSASIPGNGHSMPGTGHDIVVIGTSAGGLEALDEVMAGLPANLPASIFLVQHMAPENTGAALVERLGRHKAFGCKLAEDGESFERGKIYIAPPDSHLLVKKAKLLVTKGARENRYRPAIDPLFRSAAVAYGSRVIGVVLTGMLDDGTAGLIAIQKCGGITVVQDPRDAAYPDMPENALNNLKVDYCVAAAAVGPLLERLTHERPGKSKRVPDDLRTEAKIAERVVGEIGRVDGLGSQAPYSCPSCGGVLWEMDDSDAQRYRCHTGHSFTSPGLLLSQSERIEETLWIALRMFEERRNLLKNMAKREKPGKRLYAERARDAEVHIERIRAMLLARDGDEGRELADRSQESGVRRKTGGSRAARYSD